MDPQNSLKRPSEDSENAQSPSKQVKLDGPDYQDLVLKVQSLERENKAQSNTISAMNNKLDKIVRLLSDLTEKEATMSKNVSNLNKLLEKQDLAAAHKVRIHFGNKRKKVPNYFLPQICLKQTFAAVQRVSGQP